MTPPLRPANAPPKPPKFAWPPRRPDPQPISNTGPATRRPAEHSPGSLALPPWSLFEQQFLGRYAGPLHERAAEAGWQPDTPTDYCPRCARSTIRPIPADGCHQCAGVRFQWDRLVRLGEYTGVLRRWVHEIKFTRWRRLGLDLGELLGHSLAAAHAEDTTRDTETPVIIPVPDATLRRLIRGIDHASVIAHGVSRVTGWPVATPLVRRFGRSQLSVAPSQRAANVARAFGIRREVPAIVQTGRRLIVIDDVVTTGATMRSCCRLARAAAAEVPPEPDRRSRATPAVWAACLARTELHAGPATRSS